MAPLLLGGLLLLVVLVLVRAIAFADPQLLIRILRYAGAAFFGAFGSP